MCVLSFLQGLEGLLCDVGNSGSEHHSGGGAAFVESGSVASKAPRASALDPILDAGNRPAHVQQSFSDGGDSGSFDFPAAGLGGQTCGRAHEDGARAHGHGSTWHRAGHGIILTGPEALRGTPAVSTVGNSPW